MAESELKWPPKTSRAKGVYTLFENFFVDNEVESEIDKNGKEKEELIRRVYHLDEKEFRKGTKGEVLINADLVFPVGKAPLQKSRTFDELFQEGKTRHFTRLQLGISSKSESVQLLREHNDVEIFRARSALERWRDELDKYPQSEDVQLQVKYHEGVVGKFIEWYILHGFDSPQLNTPQSKENEELRRVEKELENLSSERRVSNEIIVRLRKKVRYRDRPAREDLEQLVDKFRFKNGKINYSRLAEKLGRTNKTAKAWCDEYGIE
jgi:hypothetical protein